MKKGGNAMKNNFQARHVLITGASRGFGKELAYAFAEKGARVDIVGRDSKQLQRVSQCIRHLSKQPSHFFSADLSKTSVQNNLLAAVRHTSGQVDVLVNAAGLPGFGPIVSFQAADLKKVLAVNTLVPLELSRQLIQGWQGENRSGMIINIASLAGQLPLPYASIHAASKAAMITFTTSLRYELRRWPIQLLTVSPSLLATGHFDQETRRYLKHQSLVDQLSAALLKQSQLDPAKAAKRVIKAAEMGKSELDLPYATTGLVQLYNLCSAPVRALIANRYQLKK
ncbi:hypothetical protein BSQ39_03395 [Loigolactobacillus backii]|nr:hypothetical protein BSQ39_03395 [Loigolactobacillus backii]